MNDKPKCQPQPGDADKILSIMLESTKQQRDSLVSALGASAKIGPALRAKLLGQVNRHTITLHVLDRVRKAIAANHIVDCVRPQCDCVAVGVPGMEGGLDHFDLECECGWTWTEPGPGTSAYLTAVAEETERSILALYGVEPDGDREDGEPAWPVIVSSCDNCIHNGDCDELVKGDHMGHRCNGKRWALATEKANEGGDP